jgi:hypothetical protein
MLSLLIGAPGGYWATILPGVTLVALGISCAAAPLTNAVLSSVDRRHTGAASGLNSAVARVGGVIAVALLGQVLGAVGANVFPAFRMAAVFGVVVALAASGCALLFNPKAN